MSDPTVLVIGLDAACFDRLDPMLADGVAPTLASLVDAGVTADLETTTPPWTPSAWPSVVTGSRPWTHGVYDFYHYAGDDPTHVSAREVSVPFIWEILSACGYGSVVVNVPVTHPLHRFDGSLVPGYIAPETTDCLVDGERVPLAELDESYRIYPRVDGGDRGKVAEYRRLVASRADMAERLAASHEWSFMMVQFQSTDAVFHSLGEDDAAVRSVFEAVDDAVGRLLDVAGEDAHVFVVSDHGMHRYEGTFHCNAWLRDRGYLDTSAESSRWGWNQRARDELVDDGEEAGSGADGGPLAAAASAAISGARRMGLTPTRVERLLGTVGLDERVADWLPESVLFDVVDAGEHVDWEASRAYCRSSASLGIRCNVVGRDANGVVPPEEFDDLRAALVRELRGVTGPDGDPLFERVYDRHRVHGTDVANECSAPDVVLRPRDTAWEVSDIVRDRVQVENSEYNHSFHGLFVACGDRIAPGASIEPNVVDVAPTVLSLFGTEPLGTMDGRVRSEILEPAVETHTPTDVGDRSFLGEDGDDVSETVENQLREMGYIE